MKRLIVLAGLLFFVTGISAQQLPVQSQFMYNKILINPATFDVGEQHLIWLKHRSQWTGFDDAPRTQLMGYNQALPNEKMVVGGYLFNDRFGPIRSIGMNGSYSYQLALNNDDLLFGMGISAGMYQIFLDAELVRLHEQDDDILTTGNDGVTLVPDAAFGTYLHNSDFYLGFSVLHLMKNRVLPYSANDLYANMALVHHYYLMGGYSFELNDDHDINANLLFDYIEGNIAHANIGATWSYKEFLNLGLGYSTNDAIILNTRFRIKEQYILGYSFDVVTSKLRDYNSGSHEITVGYRLFAD